MNRQWLKNLATAEYVNGNWLLEDPNAPGFSAQLQVQEVLQTLGEKMREAIETFNVYARSNRQLRLYKVSRSPAMNSCGFMLLMGRVQVKLEQVGPKLKTEGMRLEGYQSTTYNMRWFAPRFDTFGDLLWVMDDKVSMTLDRLCLQVIEDTIRLAFETGSLEPHAQSAGVATPSSATKKKRSFLQW